MKIHITQTDTPRIYVGTYRKYNDGDLTGAWIDLTEFDDYDAFVARCKALHADESDPEFMIQDFECFPEGWYAESGLPNEETFDKIRDFADIPDEEREAYADFIDYEGSDIPDINTFRDRFCGNMTEEEYAEQCAEEMGYYEAMERAGINANYFDFEAFARDLFIGDVYRTKNGNIFRRD